MMPPVLHVEWPEVLVGAIVGTALGLVATSLFQSRLDRALVRLWSRLRGGNVKPRSLHGIWRSRYVYEAAGYLREQPGHADPLCVDEFYLVLKAHSGVVVGHSIQRTEEASLNVILELDGSLATGTWREWVQDRERTYHGAAQLVLNHTGDELKGMWTGFDQTGEIRSGEWVLRRESTQTSWRHRRAYEQRSDLAWRAPATSADVAKRPGELNVR